MSRNETIQSSRKVVQTARDGVRWEVTPDFEACLDGVLEAASRGKVIKETPSKLVTLCQYEGKDYYTKRYRHAAVPLRSLKFFFKPSQARQEWELAGLLADRHIPIVNHMAFGEHWSGSGLKESILITEGFDGIPIRRAGPDFAPEVLDLVQRMHEIGAMQQDLHGQNILVRTANREARLVDLHGIVVRKSLSDAEKEENLALLRKFLPVTVDGAIRQRATSIRRRHKSRRARRSLRRNRDFEVLNRGGLAWQIRRALLTPKVEAILSDPDGFLEQCPELRKQGRSSTVGLGDGFVLKRYNYKKALNAFKDLIRSSRAHRAFQKTYHLELVDIPTARAIGAAARRPFGCPTVSYLVMERIPGAVEVKQCPHLSEALVVQMAELIGHLHLEGFSHRDLKTANLLLEDSGKLHLIDLEGLVFEGDLSSARAQSDLDRLFLSARQHPDWNEELEKQFVTVYRAYGA